MSDGFDPYRPPRLPLAESRRRGAALEAELQQRRSVRFFSDAPVPRDLIETAIRTASTAPSGAHQQPWTFVAVSDPDTKRRIRVAAEAEERRGYEGGRMPPEWRQAIAHLGTDWRKPFLETVPWLIVLFAQNHGWTDDGARKKHYYVKESVGLAGGLFIASLHAMGLATLTHTPSPMRFLSEILGRPANEQAFVLFPVGYPAADCVVPQLVRKSLDEVAVFNPAQTHPPGPPASTEPSSTDASLSR
jgi:iodotyrosine deiodinase